MPGDLQQTHKVWLMLGSTAVLLVLLGITMIWFRDSFGLSALALGSMVVLLWALVIFAALMNIVGLSDKTQALGLPEGSIRAIIALALVGLFAVLASTVLNGPSVVVSAGVKLTELALIREVNPTRSLIVEPIAKKGNDEQTYKVTTPAGPADDFMKQMLTLVGTLMTAITAFYFGGRTASPADVSRGPPRLAAVANNPVVVDHQPAKIELTGSDLNNVKSVRISNKVDEYVAQGVLSNGSQVLAFIPFRPEHQVDGVWSVAVTDDTGRVSSLANGLTVTPAPALRLASPTTLQSLAAGTTESAVTIRLTGREAARVSAVKLVSGDKEIAATDVAAAGADTTCKALLTAGTWTVRATVAGQAIDNIGTITVK